MRIRTLGAIGGVLCGLMAASAHAHGVVGQRTFIEPFVTEDVNPKNEFVIARPEWTKGSEGRAFSFVFGLKKMLADRFSITLDSEWDSIRPEEGPHETGFNNLGITLKYAVFKAPGHEAIVSLALEATAPTGAARVDS